MTRALSAAADPKKPYGDVTYADPGFQADKKKRYPLDSEEHCRAAWSYISMPKNAAKYSPEDLAKVKAKIRAALKRYGAEVQAAAPAQMLGVELARPGPWKLSSGQTEFNAEHLRDAADFFTATGGQALPIKLGHHDDRFDGEPTFGLVTNVRYAEDERGPVLLGDINGMPGWLAAAAPARWPNRSVEGWQNVEFDGREYSLTLSGLVFLGVTPPGVRNIRSLSDLQTALAASSATRVFASAPEDDAATPPEPDGPEEPEESVDLSEQDIQDPAAEAVVPPSEEKEAGMDPAKIRERLGLDDDVSDDDVMEALAYAGFTPAPEPEPVAASGESQQTVDQRIAAAAARGGVVTIDAAQIVQFQEGMVRAAALAKRLDERDRDEIITAAVKAGKFPPARRQHYEKSWDADPAGTRELIASLAAGLVPVTASGYAGDGTDHEEDELDREIARLSPLSRKGA
jgi:Mu-like prophage I protein